MTVKCSGCGEEFDRRHLLESHLKFKHITGIGDPGNLAAYLARMEERIAKLESISS